ncbi:MAG TPA: hypothetical protein VFZ61_05150, partial [Polyangiales bacterium]
LLSLLWLASSGARAEVVVLACAEECTAAQFQGLELELRGYGVTLTAHPAPAGFTSSARSADAQRTNAQLGAAVILWVEHDDPLRLCAYSQRAARLHEAPLPATPPAIDPAVFAAVAGSVALEALRAAPAPPLAPAAVVVAPAPGPAAPSPSTPAAPAPDEGSSSARSPSAGSRHRVFVRAGAAVGFAMVGKNSPTDRAPPVYMVEEAARAAAESGDLTDAQEYLEVQGYDCDVQMVDRNGPGLAVGNCKVGIYRSGMLLSAAIDLALGFDVTPRIALALTARIDPTAGLGTLAHALLGGQVEVALLQPQPTGFWLSGALGFGGGQIQVQPSSSSKDAPYTRSGLFGVRAGLLFGYRFLPRLGIVATPVVHALFPDTLWAVETNVNLEVRL